MPLWFLLVSSGTRYVIRVWSLLDKSVCFDDIYGGGGGGGLI